MDQCHEKPDRYLFRALPASHSCDLGFCDLRVAETREAQAALAQDTAFSGFCYYHYWFNGKRLLNRPFDEVLRSGKPEFPFCLCWANENWTRRWDGYDQEVLIGQNHSLEDGNRDHIRHLFNAFEDRRYIRVHGKPLFLVYRTGCCRIQSGQWTCGATRRARRGSEIFTWCESKAIAKRPTRAVSGLMRLSNLPQLQHHAVPRAASLATGFAGPCWEPAAEGWAAAAGVFRQPRVSIRRSREAHAGKALAAVHLVQVRDAVLGQLQRGGQKTP